MFCVGSCVGSEPSPAPTNVITGTVCRAQRPAGALLAPGSAPASVVSGVLIRKVKAAGVVVVGRPEGRRSLVVQLSADAARTRLSFLTTLCVENGAAAITPADTQKLTLQFYPSESQTDVKHSLPKGLTDVKFAKIKLLPYSPKCLCKNRTVQA